MLNDRIKSPIRKFLTTFAYYVVQPAMEFLTGRQATFLPWNEDPNFLKIMKEIVGLTMMDTARCFMLYQYALQARNLEGVAAEVGVYKGGSAKLLAHLFQPVRKPLHLFDTFQGMPEVHADIDLRHKRGDLNDTSLERVRSTLASFSEIQFYPGKFPETVAPVKDKKFCFVHVDVDIYDSVMECCKFFYPRLVLGGTMIFDDYSALQCPGVKRALDEFFSDKKEKPYYLLTGQGLVWRH